jgi:phosphate transport system substrate-binding protein
MKRSLAVILGIVAIGAVIYALPHAMAQSAVSVIRVCGADSMMGRMQILTKVFMKNNPDIKIEVAEGGLVDVGITSLIENKCDVAMASRGLTEDESAHAVQKGVELVERLVGYGGIVIITHPQNLVNELSVDQVRKIFKGEITRWDQLGGRTENITVVITDETRHPGTFVFMEHDFLKSKFAKDAVTLTQFPGVMAKVAKTPGAIGYVRIRDAFESKPKQRESIKVLEIKREGALVGVMPSREGVNDGSYPIRRPYYLYYNSKADGNIKKYTDFIVSKGWGSQNL